MHVVIILVAIHVAIHESSKRFVKFCLCCAANQLGGSPTERLLRTCQPQATCSTFLVQGKALRNGVELWGCVARLWGFLLAGGGVRVRRCFGCFSHPGAIQAYWRSYSADGSQDSDSGRLSDLLYPMPLHGMPRQAQHPPTPRQP